jgi:F-type H+-transporting ATPase subunit a
MWVVEVEQAAEGARDTGAEVGGMIYHHVTNGWDWDVGVHTFEMDPHAWTIHLGGLEVNLGITRHVIMMLIAAGLLILIALLVRRKLALIPKGFASVIEGLVLFIRDEIAIPTMGKHAASRYTPYLCSTFFFILTCNLLGLIPFGSTATGNISVTAALAIVAFLMIQGAGMRKMGVFGYFKHLVPHGVPLWLAPVMVIVEILGVFAKPFALCVRLFANMTAGHVVLLSLIGLTFIMGLAVGGLLALLFGIFIYFLELFVALLQAYIFTMLTSLFIGLLVAEEH